jgi:molybdopterin-binding protein
MAEVAVDIEAGTMISAITASSAGRLGLKIGDEVVVIVKATEVMIGK